MDPDESYTVNLYRPHKIFNDTNEENNENQQSFTMADIGWHIKRSENTLKILTLERGTKKIKLRVEVKSAVKLKANVIPRKGNYKFGFYDLLKFIVFAFVVVFTKRYLWLTNITVINAI